MGLFLIARTFLSGALSAIWRTLSRLSAWQLVSLALAALSLWLYAGKQIEHRARVKAEAQILKLVDANKRAATEAKRRTDTANQITAQLRRAKDEADRRIAADAQSLLMRGPGRAACLPALPQGSGGPQGSSPAAGTPVAPVPDDLIGLPFPEAVRLAQNHDTLRSEVLAWREWYIRQAANAGNSPR